MKRLLLVCVVSAGFALSSWGGIGWSSSVIIDEDRDNDWTPLEYAKVLYIRLVRLHQMLGVDSMVPSNLLQEQIRATELMVLRIVHMLRHDDHHGDLDDITPPDELRNLGRNTALYRQLREAELGDLEGRQPIAEYAQPPTHADLENLDAHISHLLYLIQGRAGVYANQGVDESLSLDSDILAALVRVRSIFTRVNPFVQRELPRADDGPACTAGGMYGGDNTSTTLFLITLCCFFLYSS